MKTDIMYAPFSCFDDDEPAVRTHDGLPRLYQYAVKKRIKVDHIETFFEINTRGCV